MSYINKEDLLAAINEVWERKYARCEWKTLYDLYRMCIRRINRATVADVVEVTRCKDCEWWTKQENSAQGRCALLGIYPTGAWYCGNGRKEKTE